MKLYVAGAKRKRDNYSIEVDDEFDDSEIDELALQSTLISALNPHRSDVESVFISNYSVDINLNITNIHTLLMYGYDTNEDLDDLPIIINRIDELSSIVDSNRFISDIFIQIGYNYNKIEVHSKLKIAALTIRSSIKNPIKAFDSLISKFAEKFPEYVRKNEVTETLKSEGKKPLSSQAVFKQLIKKKLGLSPDESYSDTGKVNYWLGQYRGSLFKSNIKSELNAYVDLIRRTYPDMNIRGENGYYYVKGPRFVYNKNTDTYTPVD